MYTTTNYGFNIVEGTDMVNPLTQLNPNFTSLDTDLKAVSDNTVDNATCIKTGTVHAVTRTNTDAKVFKFTATGNWNTGDTMTVDGTLVSVFATDGSAPADGCFVINTEVIAAIQGTRVTIYVNSVDASNVPFDDNAVNFTASNVQNAIVALNGSAVTLLQQQALALSDTSYLLSGDISEYRFIVLSVSWSGGTPSNYMFTIAGAVAGVRLHLNNITSGEYGQVVGFTDNTHVTAFASNSNVCLNVYGIK